MRCYDIDVASDEIGCGIGRCEVHESVAMNAGVGGDEREGCGCRSLCGLHFADYVPWLLLLLLQMCC